MNNSKQRDIPSSCSGGEASSEHHTSAAAFYDVLQFCSYSASSEGTLLSRDRAAGMVEELKKDDVFTCLHDYFSIVNSGEDEKQGKEKGESLPLVETPSRNPFEDCTSSVQRILRDGLRRRMVLNEVNETAREEAILLWMVSQLVSGFCDPTAQRMCGGAVERGTFAMRLLRGGTEYVAGENATSTTFQDGALAHPIPRAFLCASLLPLVADEIEWRETAIATSLTGESETPRKHDVLLKARENVNGSDMQRVIEQVAAMSVPHISDALQSRISAAVADNKKLDAESEKSTTSSIALSDSALRRCFSVVESRRISTESHISDWRATGPFWVHFSERNGTSELLYAWLLRYFEKYFQKSLARESAFTDHQQEPNATPPLNAIDSHHRIGSFQRLLSMLPPYVVQWLLFRAESLTNHHHHHDYPQRQSSSAEHNSQISSEDRFVTVLLGSLLPDEMPASETNASILSPSPSRSFEVIVAGILSLLRSAKSASPLLCAAVVLSVHSFVEAALKCSDSLNSQSAAGELEESKSEMDVYGLVHNFYVRLFPNPADSPSDDSVLTPSLQLPWEKWRILECTHNSTLEGIVTAFYDERKNSVRPTPQRILNSFTVDALLGYDYLRAAMNRTRVQENSAWCEARVTLQEKVYRRVSYELLTAAASEAPLGLSSSSISNHKDTCCTTSRELLQCVALALLSGGEGLEGDFLRSALDLSNAPLFVPLLSDLADHSTATTTSTVSCGAALQEWQRYSRPALVVEVLRTPFVLMWIGRRIWQQVFTSFCARRKTADSSTESDTAAAKNEIHRLLDLLIAVFPDTIEVREAETEADEEEQQEPIDARTCESNLRGIEEESKEKEAERTGKTSKGTKLPAQEVAVESEAVSIDVSQPVPRRRLQLKMPQVQLRGNTSEGSASDGANTGLPPVPPNVTTRSSAAAAGEHQTESISRKRSREEKAGKDTIISTTKESHKLAPKKKKKATGSDSTCGELSTVHFLASERFLDALLQFGVGELDTEESALSSTLNAQSIPSSSAAKRPPHVTSLSRFTPAPEEDVIIKNEHDKDDTASLQASPQRNQRQSGTLAMQVLLSTFHVWRLHRGLHIADKPGSGSLWCLQRLEYLVKFIPPWYFAYEPAERLISRFMSSNTSQ